MRAGREGTERCHTPARVLAPSPQPLPSAPILRLVASIKKKKKVCFYFCRDARLLEALAGEMMLLTLELGKSIELTSLASPMKRVDERHRVPSSGLVFSAPSELPLK